MLWIHMAAGMIAAADTAGLPVRRHIAVAWILTLPVCVFLGAMLFALSLNAIALFGLG
ncbi:MAG: hypothetical protein HYX27_09580 [Acidobacteria bacterium]|nr:hypothetical protein [Acidobacteriota bacterium]